MLITDYTSEILQKQGVDPDALPDNLITTHLKEIVENMGSGGSGGGGVNVTASVGQTIVVKEVDANGKPTKWEAADYQPRTHGVAIAELLPPTPAIFSEEDGAFFVEVNFEFALGHTYTVNWNGTPYTCVAVDVNGVGVGNADALLGTGDSGEPFFCGASDGVLFILPLDGSTEPVIGVSGETYKTIEKQYLPSDILYGAKGYTGGVFDLNGWLFRVAGAGALTLVTTGFVNEPITKEQFEVLEEAFANNAVYLSSVSAFANANKIGDNWELRWTEVIVQVDALVANSMVALLRWSDEHECVQRSCTVSQSVRLTAT